MELSTHTIGQIILMARELDRAEGELRGLIERLDVDEQSELVALMWIGRGSFDVSEWDEALATAVLEASTPTADYLIGSPHMSDHLEAGMEAFGMSPMEAVDGIFQGRN